MIRLHFLFLYFALALEAVCRILGSILNLNKLLGASESVSHLGDLVFQQMLIEGVCDLHPTDVRSGSHVVSAVIQQSFFALKITDILFEAFPKIHFDGEGVVVVPL